MKNYDKPLTKKDEFNLTGNMVINFENEMEGICIENYGNETITFITDEQLNTLKANQGFYDNLTPFNKLEIQTSQTYSGNISGYVLGRF